MLHKATHINCDWPRIENCLTASGYGYEKGDKPCFCTKYRYTLFIPHSLTSDIVKARYIFDQIIPTIIDEIYLKPGDRKVTVTFGGVGKESPRELLLNFAFGHILVEPIE